MGLILRLGGVYETRGDSIRPDGWAFAGERLEPTFDNATKL